MTKQVIDNAGNTISVSDGTLTRNSDCKDYLLNPEEESERVTLRTAYAAAASERALAKVMAARKEEAGSIEDQLDTQYWDKINGTQNWLDHITAINSRHPKPN